MSKAIRVTEDSVSFYFKGITIPVKGELGGIGNDDGFYYVPGWECRSCGWKVGALGLPPIHVCAAFSELDSTSTEQIGGVEE